MRTQQQTNQHPHKHLIIGKPKDQLLIRRSYVVAAIDFWNSNTDDTKRQYNIAYFNNELDLIDNELMRNERKNY